MGEGVMGQAFKLLKSRFVLLRLSVNGAARVRPPRFQWTHSDCKQQLLPHVVQILLKLGCC